MRTKRVIVILLWIIWAVPFVLCEVAVLFLAMAYSPFYYIKTGKMYIYNTHTWWNIISFLALLPNKLTKT